jgi:hypothetical protein
LRDDFLKYIDKFQEDLTLHASTKEEYDLCASKTLAWMEQYLSQADDEPRIENRSAAKNFRTLQSLFEQLKTVLDLNQPLALPKYQPLDEAAEKALYWENFGLLETSKKSVAALKIVEQRANEYAELLGYKIDPSGANERNSLKNLFGDVTEYYRQKEEEKEDGNWLPKERTDHDEAVKWQNQIKCIHHAVKQWDDLVNNYENRFRPKISAKNTDVLKRKIENCRAYAESQIAAFFEVASDESRLDEPGVFETLAELKKSTRDFTESSQAKEKKEVIR